MLNTTAGMASKLVNIVTGFIMRSIFIHTLGAEYAGISSLFTDILTLLSFAELGISSSIAFSLYKPIAEGDHRKISALMQFFKRAYQLVACVILVLGLLMIPFMDFIVPPEKISSGIRQEVSRYLILIFILYVIDSAVSYLFIYKSTLLTAHQQQRKISSIQMIMSFVRVIVESCILLLLNLIIKEHRIYIYIAYLVAGIIITRTTNAIISHCADKRFPYVDYKTKESLTQEEKKQLYKNVGALMIYRICQEINASLDSIVISALYGPLWVGYVSNYRLVTNKTRIVILQFSNALTPSMGNLAVEKDPDYQYTTFKNLQFVFFWIGCFCSVNFIVLLNPFIELWIGKEFVMNLMMPIALTAVIYSNTILDPVSAVRNANGLFVQGKYRPVFMCIINVTLSIALALVLGIKSDEWGVIGVKIATIFAHIATTQWYDPMLIYKHIFKRPVRSYFIKVILQLGLTSAITAVTYCLGGLLFGMGSFSGLIPGVHIAVSFIVKLVLCLTIPNVVIWLIYRRTTEYMYTKNLLTTFADKFRNKLFRRKSSKSAVGKTTDNAEQ